MKVLLMVAAMMCSLMFAQTSFASGKVNINTASAQELQEVKGIGEKTAKAIVQYRKKHGSFSSVSDLENVKGIGEKKLKKMKGSLKAGKGSSKPKGKEHAKDKKKHKKDMKDKKKKKDKKDKSKKDKKKDKKKMKDKKKKDKK